MGLGQPGEDIRRQSRTFERQIRYGILQPGIEQVEESRPILQSDQLYDSLACRGLGKLRGQCCGQRAHIGKMA